MSTTLVLVRHGETAWNAEGRLQGQTDIPLNDVGREQARVAGMELSARAWDVVVCSSLGRAVETAQLIGAELGLELSERISGLSERHYGKAEGHRVRDLPREEIDRLLDSAELEDLVTRRGLDALLGLVERYEGQRIVAVAHGTLIRLTLDAFSAGPPMKIMCNGQTVQVDVEALRQHMATVNP